MQLDEVLTWLEKRGTRSTVEGMARYGIETKLRVFGVPMGTLLALKKQLGKDHALAEALWASGCYEARLLAALVGEPERVTRRQMNAWAADFENWGDCDTVCFHLFDRTPFAWEKVHRWATSPREFIKRAAFSMMASLTVHDKAALDAQFLALLPLIEEGARDERHFVKKSVNWALCSIGKRSLALFEAAFAVAERLAMSEEAACRWVGKSAMRDLSRPLVRAGLLRKAKKTAKR